MNFLGIAILITVISLVVLVIPILRPRAIRMDSDNTNAAILKEQINELESDLKEDLISQEQFASAKTDLELGFATGIKSQATNKVVNKDKIIGVAFIALLIPLISFITYQEIKPEPKISANTEQPSITDMIKSLEKKLEDNPDNVDGWIMLARSYDAQGNINGAVTAYRKALKLNPNDSWIMAQLGYAISKVSGSLAGEPAQLFTKALEIAPNNMDARFLLGKYHFQTESYQKALENWEHLLKIVNEKDAAPVKQAINAAKAKLGIKVDDAKN